MKFKRFLTIIFTLAILTIAATGLSACKYHDIEVDLNFDELMYEPVDAVKAKARAIADVNQITTASEFTKDPKVIESAVELYRLGDENLQNADFFACVSKGSGGADISAFNLRGNMSVREMTIKNGSEWYYRSCGMVMNTETLNGSSVNSGDSLLPVIRGILDYGKRKYSPDGEHFYVQTVGTGDLDAESINRFLTADWLNAISFVNKKGKPRGDLFSFDTQADYIAYDAYHSSHLEVDNAAITPDAITEAKITRDDRLGIFKVSFKVDVTSDALDTNLFSLRKSVADDLRYVYQTVEFEIWDCGLFRTYGTDSSWATRKLGGFLSGESQNKYMRSYTYNQSAVKRLVISSEEVQELIDFCNND